jgi:AcrR family transcriptional regulator
VGPSAGPTPESGLAVPGGARPNTRELLIDATERLLREGGFAAVTTQSVARSAGYAEGTLYRHFESRDELVSATICERMPRDLEHLLEETVQCAGCGDIETNLRRFISAAIPLFVRFAPLISMLAAHPSLAVRHYERLREQGRGPRHSHERLAAYFREEQRLGRIRHDINPRAAAALVIGACFDHSLMLQLFGEDPSGLTEGEIPAAIATILAHGLHEPTRDRVESESKVKTDARP